ncbi:DUF1214 domain-containing protein [Frankia sp. AiPa1]|uniref:DUF1214 domain-containing protein n=1 Tax=Frankia sp. AiPa1 TaxID=573492 RepID=UPI00202B9F9D|nr:DUF1214 domain-containing protein [Frankia sp. AiPa1]MCL9762924.1 DUF1214 domain-containing protein [Frankia sp. AiPa1]
MPGIRANDHRFGLAAEAYVFGYPLVSSVRLLDRYATGGLGSRGDTGYHYFDHQGELPGPRSVFVSLEADVLSSIALVDLAVGPVILRLPHDPEPPVLVVLTDTWRNAFAYLGSGGVADRGRTKARPADQADPSENPGGAERSGAPGSGSASYVLVPPGWTRQLPAGPTPLAAPTRLLVVTVKIALDDRAAAALVRRRQDELRLCPLDPQAPQAPGPPRSPRSVCDDLRFWEELRLWLAAFPPSTAEADYARRFAPLGLFDDPSPYVDPDPSLAWSLRGGLRAGRDGLEQLVHAGRVLRNGWSSTPHALDFNIDFLGPGTRDDPAWRIADRQHGRLARAIAARQPVGATHGYQCLRANCLFDTDGHRLTGAHRYTIDLAPPPDGASWTLTMHDAPDYYLVDNPLCRYWLGSRARGLHHARDGSVRLFLQCEPPQDSTERANWLPAAVGDFRPDLRVDCPGPAVLDDDYAPPPIRRVD